MVPFRNRLRRYGTIVGVVDKVRHSALLERVVEARLAQLDDAVVVWQSVEVARESLQAELSEQVRRIEDDDLARQFMEVCPVPGARLDDYRNVWLTDADARNDRDAPGTSDWALVGPRFRGLDLERPFVDVVVGTPAPRTLEDLHDLADRAARRFAVFAPRHARFLIAPSRLAEIGCLEPAFVERVVLAAPFGTMRSLPLPRVDGVEVTLRPARDLTFEDSYRRAYAQLLEEAPDQAEYAQMADRDVLTGYVEDGGAFEVLVDGAVAGFVAAFRDQAFGLRGFHVGEMFLYPPARGRGLGRSVQRSLVEALPAADDDVFFGVVDARNHAAVRTATGCGRQVVAAHVWMPVVA